MLVKQKRFEIKSILQLIINITYLKIYSVSRDPLYKHFKIEFMYCLENIDHGYI